MAAEYQPDWRSIVTAALKSKRPKRFAELRSEGELAAFLDRVTAEARDYYRACVKVNSIPDGADEMVMHDIVMEAVASV